MKVIVIGSKGFIGTHLVKHFECLGYEVWGADVIVDYENTEKYFLIDSTNSNYVSVFQEQEYDFCFNCSGAASVPDSLSNPERDYQLNTVNVFKILEAIKRVQPKCRFVNLSSAAVYGNPQCLPISESATLNPLSPYGIHKFQAEQICKEYYDFWGIQTCSLRIFSVFGIGLQKQLFWDLYKKASKGKPITLFGTGDESRDFINVIDLVKAIKLISEKSDFKADIVNVANGEEVLIKDAASVFFSVFKDRINYSFSGDSRKGDPVNWRADISKLTSFGYVPSVSFKEGLIEYYEWINKCNFKF